MTIGDFEKKIGDFAEKNGINPDFIKGKIVSYFAQNRIVKLSDENIGKALLYAKKEVFVRLNIERSRFFA